MGTKGLATWAGIGEMGEKMGEESCESERKRLGLKYAAP
jgi:hypothetical protein